MRDSIGGYSLVSKLASTSVAETYLAVKRWLGDVEQSCVVKVIDEAVADEPGFVEGLANEARLALELRHPNVVSITDLGYDRGRWYVVSERVDGRDLGELAEHCWQGHRPPPVAACLEIAIQLLDGLEHCHRLAAERGELAQAHRELNPSNVLISFDGTVRLKGFGLALSPTRLRRAPIDPRDDLYCVGALLYGLLTGERFTPRSAPAEIVSHLRERSQPGLRPIHEALEDVLIGVLSFGKRRRYGSARELRRALAKAQAKIAPGYDRHDLGDLMNALFDTSARQRELRSLIAGDTEASLRLPSASKGAVKQPAARQSRFRSQAKPVVAKSVVPMVKQRTGPNPPPHLRARRPSPAKLPPPLPSPKLAPARRCFGAAHAASLPTVIGADAPARRRPAFGPPTLVTTGMSAPVDDADVIEVIHLEGPSCAPVASSGFEIRDGELRKVSLTSE